MKGTEDVERHCLGDLYVSTKLNGFTTKNLQPHKLIAEVEVIVLATDACLTRPLGVVERSEWLPWDTDGGKAECPENTCLTFGL
jgi:hypothetical protein